MEVIGDRTFLGMLRSGGMHQRGRGREPSLPVACIEGTDGVYLVGKGHSGKLLRNLLSPRPAPTKGSKLPKDGRERSRKYNIRLAGDFPDNIRWYIPYPHPYICSSHDYTLLVPADSIGAKNASYNVPAQKYSHPKAFHRKGDYRA
mgnify:CR=1 FL=1